MAVLPLMDHTILEGRRGKEDQNKAFESGKSKLQWPNGKHNTLTDTELSQAVDATPYPVDFKDINRHCFFAGIVIGVAHNMGIRLRWGGAWDMDYNKIISDQNFDDLVHFELVEKGT